MKREKLLTVYIISALIIAALDLAYIVFTACEYTFIIKGTAFLFQGYKWLSLAAIIINALLIVFTGVYLIFRKK